MTPTPLKYGSKNLKFFEKIFKFTQKKSIFFLKFDKNLEKSVPFLTILVHFSQNFPREVPKVLFEIRPNDPPTPLVLFHDGFHIESTDPLFLLLFFSKMDVENGNEPPHISTFGLDINYAINVSTLPLKTIFNHSYMCEKYTIF